MKFVDTFLREGRSDPPGVLAMLAMVYLLVAAVFLLFAVVITLVTHGIALLVGGALFALWWYIKRQVVKSRGDA